MKNKRKTPACPAWLPGRYVVSKFGRAAAYVVVTNKRSGSGEYLLRLRFLAEDVTGPPVWTVSLLLATGSRFLKRAPRLSR